MKMKKLGRKTIIIFILVILLLCFAVIAVKGLIKFQMEEEYKRENIKTFVCNEQYDEILYVETGAINPVNTVVATTQDTRSWYTRLIIPGQCVCLPDCEYTVDLGENDVVELEKANYKIYDLTTGRVLNTIDVKAIAEELEPDKIITDSYLGEINIETGGDKYLNFSLMNKKDQSDKTQWRQLYVNLETEKAIIRLGGDGLNEIKSLSADGIGDTNEYSALLDDMIGLIQANGFEPYDSLRDEYEKTPGLDVWYWGYGIVQVDIPKGYLPERNETLYAEFPGLAEYEGSDDEILTFYISGSPSSEEILKMFMEDGQEISFEGCVLPANSSKDGQEHEIHSFEEYDQWCEYS